MFRGCSAHKSIEIPSGVSIIERWAFGECISLENVKIPETVFEVEYSAFSKCTSLENIKLPESLKKAKLPDKWNAIPQYTFCNCISLESYIVGDNVRTISSEAFMYCSSLENVYLSSAEPPLLGTCCFDQDMPDRRFYVPEASLEVYKEQWSEYADQIVGM